MTERKAQTRKSASVRLMPAAMITVAAVLGVKAIGMAESVAETAGDVSNCCALLELRADGVGESGFGARVPTQPTTAKSAATEVATAQGNGLRRGTDGALERGSARVAGSSASTTDGGLDGSAELSAAASASVGGSDDSDRSGTGGMLAILRVHSTRSSRAAKVRVMGAPPAGVEGVSGGIGGVAGVCGPPGG